MFKGRRLRLHSTQLPVDVRILLYPYLPNIDREMCETQADFPGFSNGRDFAGVVVRASKTSDSRIQQGSVVCGCSTDYRDIRKAAFQEYLVANEFNVSRVPDGTGIDEVATMGTAFTAAIIGLSICFGIDFSKLYNRDIPQGPDLLSEARIHANDLPKGTEDEV